MSNSSKSKILFLFFLSLTCIACSESEEQQQFEEEAYSSPSGIMEVDEFGEPVENGEQDTDDWRIAPEFSGLVGIFMIASPNPVSFNGKFNIQLDVKFLEAVDGLELIIFQLPTDPTPTSRSISQGILDPGLVNIPLEPSQFASSAGTGNFGNTYRIVIRDAQQTVITYGDVLVE